MTKPSKDFYSVLEIGKFSEKSAVKNSYKRLAKIHHPDKGGDINKFLEIKNAYDVLSSHFQKEKYDLYLKSKNAGKNAARLREKYEIKDIDNAANFKDFIKKYEDYMLMHPVHINNTISTNNASHFFAINLLIGIGGVFLQSWFSYVTSVFLIDSLVRIVQVWTKDPLKSSGIFNFGYMGIKFCLDRISSKIL